jgi:glutamate dehydrogenase
MKKNPSAESQKKALTDQVVSILKEGLSARRARIAERYAQQCFRRVPIEDLAAEAPATLATILRRQLEMIATREPGERLIQVYNPSENAEGWESPHTIVELLNDDMPFLVDTASLTFSEMGIGVHLIIHPVIRVSRDKQGRLTTIHEKTSGRGTPESIMQFQIDRHTDAGDLERIRQELQKAMMDLRLAVADWKGMEAALLEAQEKLSEWAAGADPMWVEECGTFLRWLLDDNFVFLGARDYRVLRSGKAHQLQLIEGSGLGILRENEDTVRSRPLTSLGEAARRRQTKLPLILTKTNARSTVHRAGYLDYIGVLQMDPNGRSIGERRFLGLFTSMAYRQNAMDTPIVRVRARNVLTNAHLVERSHAWKSMVHILESLPRDELFQASSRELLDVALGVLNLQDRQRVRLFIRQERYGRFYSCLVYIPREQFNTENREAIQNLLERALKGRRLDYSVHVSESRLARLEVIVRPRRGAKVSFDVPALEQKIVEAVRSWSDELRQILVEKLGEEDGLRFAGRFCKAFPEAYKEDVSPWVAAFDVENAAAVDEGASLRMSLYRPELHLPDDRSLWIQDFDMIPAVGRELNLDIIREVFQDSFEKALLREIESDGFNRLVIAAQMSWRQVKVLRAYCKYLLQTGIPFSLNYMAETLSGHPAIARMLIELFEAMFDPARDDESSYRRDLGQRQLEKRFEVLAEAVLKRDPVLQDYIEDMAAARRRDRAAQVESIRKAFLRALESVTSLDEDRILHAFYRVIRATLRTNCFREAEGDEPRDFLSFKLDSGALPELPRPRPYREIWLYSPRVEGIHLRGGPIARGGLRWSDRREDFRTEVLGLMKAQNVKNTMIVPVGAKGGFVVKRMPDSGDRDAVAQEVRNCYSSFINGLLDITDNLDEDEIVPPASVVRHDDDDPYLVVAADKGTATFSDIANGIAVRRGFWLGDAFASGGSVGYDHKGMGITARGAWEGVKRHFREMGRDIQREPFSVVGIGDMGGDVFGNGMLLSRHIRLRAAFNHLHIFLDPTPDEKASLRERRRLFRASASGWADYREELISRGGGVYSRQAKSIPLSREVRDWLGLETERLTPGELVRELLKAPVDLLWNGGIGTYVKAANETHTEVGDLANDALRVDGRDLRCSVIGEGGNLGVTQKGRIEFARQGGRINTDFIDNSAGVDTSDHEVNIKILLNLALQADLIGDEERVRLLAQMTDEVASLVIRSNYLQSQAISMMERFAGDRLGAKQHFINVLEDEGVLDRGLEFLPEEDVLNERREHGEGLYRPELAVLLSYSKIRLYQQLLDSDVPEDSYLSGELSRYFPGPLRERFGSLMARHRLRREIIATQVTNSVVNRMGASFVLRMCEDTQASPAEVARAFTIAREVFDARDFWDRVEALDNKVHSALQIDALLEMWRLLRQSTRWLLNLPGRKLAIQPMVERLAPGLRTLQPSLRESMSAEEKEELARRTKPYIEGGFPRRLAHQAVMLERLFPALDVVETAARRRMDVNRVARVFYGLADALDLRWLRAQVESLDVIGQWHAISRANLRDELFTAHNGLVESVLKAAARKKDPVQAWMDANETAVQPVIRMMAHMRSEDQMDYATISVAVRALAQLVRESSA